MNTHQPIKSNWISLLAGWALLVSLLSSPVSGAQAQYGGWSFPQTIPAFELDNFPPILVPDQNGNVHAFSSQYIETRQGGSIRAVVYNKWTLETGWTPPIDILLSPINEARLTDVYLDDVGVMHLAFWGGNGTDADIYYSQSPLAEVDNPRAWSIPIIIGDQAGDPAGAVFAQPAGGDLVVIFNGRQYGNGLYVVRSTDRGSTWSFPTPIFITRDEAPNIAYLEVLKSNSGWLHLIWNVYSLNGQGRGIYYARSADGEVWDQPNVFAEADEGLGTQTPTIIEHDNSLFAFYNLPPKIIMQRSLDDGKSWQDPVILFPRHVGVNGSLSPVVDVNDTLHLFFGQRISGSPDIHGMWHSRWENPRWTEPEALIKGPAVTDPVGLNSFDPYAANAIVIQGVTILTTWRTDPGLKGNGVWFSYKTLDAPEVPTKMSGIQNQPFVEMTPSPGATTAAETQYVPTESPRKSTPLASENSILGRVLGSGYLIILIMALVLIFLLTLYIAKIYRTKS
jgi:hypothetical protein